MKKVLALVLALVITLSLLPMNVWAEVASPTDLPDSSMMGVAEFKQAYNLRIDGPPWAQEAFISFEVDDGNVQIAARPGNFNYKQSLDAIILEMWSNWCAMSAANRETLEAEVPGAAKLITLCAYQVYTPATADVAAAEAFCAQYFVDVAELTLQGGYTSADIYYAWDLLDMGPKAYLQQEYGSYPYNTQMANFTQMMYTMAPPPPAPPGIIDKLRGAGYTAPDAITVNFPNALVQGTDYVYTYENGVLTITLKKGVKADWEAAYQSMSAAGNNIQVSVEFPNVPTEAVRGGMFSGNIDGGAINKFINIDIDSSCCDRAIGSFMPVFVGMLASVNEQESGASIAPLPRDNDHCFVLAYVDGNGNAVAKWAIEFRVLLEESFSYKVPAREIPLVDAERIHVFGDWDSTVGNYTDIDANAWDVAVSDGSVVVKAKNTDALPQRVGYIEVDAPEGYTVKGQTWTKSNMTGLWFPGTNVLEFIWFNGSTNHEIREQLRYTLMTAKPYLANIGDPATFTLSNPALSDSNSSVILDYDSTSGRYHTSFKSDRLPTVEEIRSGMVMSVPQDAVTYRWNNSEGNRDPQAATGGVSLETLRGNSVVPVEEPSGYTVPIANVGELILENGELKVYYSRTRNITERVVEWYSDMQGQNPIGVTYLYGNNDDFFWSTDSQSVATVTDVVDVPTLEGVVGVTLTGVRYPQLGNKNKLYIELQASKLVTDKNVVYIPYSYCNGMNWEVASQLKENGKRPIIHHYTDDHGSYSVIKGEYTEYGIRFVTPDFSPFTIEWDPEPLYVNTGSDTNPVFVDTYTLDKGEFRYLWLFSGETMEDAVNGSYTPKAIGDIGTLIYEEGPGKGFKWDTTGATESEGYLEVVSKNGDVYRMPVTVNLNPQQGGEEGDGEQPSGDSFEVFDAGNAYVKFRVIPGQEQVLDLSASHDTNGILTVTATVKNVPPSAWRKILQREDAFAARFEFCLKDETDDLPDVAYYLGDFASVAEGIGILKGDVTENKTGFQTYNQFQSTRTGGLDFVWAMQNEDGSFDVIPQTGEETTIWIWRDNKELDQCTTGGFMLKVVHEEGVSSFTVPADPMVAATRISAISNPNLEEIIALEADTNGKLVYEDGVLTYNYLGGIAAFDEINEEVQTAAVTDGGGIAPDGCSMYRLLRVRAPDGYVAKGYEGRFASSRVDAAGKDYMDLEYRFCGFGNEQSYTLTWCKGEGATYEEYVEKIIINTPSSRNMKTWLDVIGRRIPEKNVTFTRLPADCGAVNSYSNGLFWTEFDSTKMLDVAPVLDATVTISVPEGAQTLQFIAIGRDGTGDPVLNSQNAWVAEHFKNDLDNSGAMDVSQMETVWSPIGALEEESFGEGEKKVQYYFSADKETRFILLKWNFGEGKESLYEHMQVDTSPYFCQWAEDLMEDSEVTDEVEVPTAVNDSLANSNIKLVARIHPQKQEDGYGQYFFELDMVKEGEGNVYTDPNGDTYFTIILPYSFMGEDWNYAKAKNLKEKPMITHFDKEYKQLAGDKGTITGEYTERGIEFKVNSFSPFTVSWTEDTKSSIGGYTPSVTPDVSVNIDSGSLNEAALAVGSAIDNGSADITPAVGYTKADIEKLQQESKLRMSIEKASDCSATDKETIDAAISKAAGTAAAPAAQYFDITVVLKHEDTGATVGKVRDTKTPISITVDLDSELQQAAKAGKYLYVVRCHDGKTAFLKAELNTDKTKVTFSTSLFSAYAVVALDKEVPVEAASAAKPTTPPAQETVTPVPEDTTPVVPDEPVTDEPVVDEAPAVDTEPANSAGLWIGVGIVALAAIVVVLAVMVVRKKRK